MSVDLLYLARDHDLPPMWDGHPVTWTGWQIMNITICPPPKPECCQVCGSLAPRVINHGRYFRLDRRTGREQHPALTAYRCPDCKTDQVCDWRGVWWDLGPEDYGDDGSRGLR